MNDVPDTELFSAYLDGELTADEQLRVEKMLAISPEARQLLEELRALSGTLQGLPQLKLGDDLASRVLESATARMLTQKPAPTATPDEELAKPAAGPAAASLNGESFKPWWKEISWKGMLGRRALAWSGIAVAIALMLRVANPPDARVPKNVSMNFEDKTVAPAGSAASSPTHAAEEVAKPRTTPAKAQDTRETHWAPRDAKQAQQIAEAKKSDAGAVSDSSRGVAAGNKDQLSKLDDKADRFKPSEDGSVNFKAAKPASEPAIAGKMSGGDKSSLEFDARRDSAKVATEEKTATGARRDLSDSKENHVNESIVQSKAPAAIPAPAVADKRPNPGKAGWAMRGGTLKEKEDAERLSQLRHVGKDHDSAQAEEGLAPGEPLAANKPDENKPDASEPPAPAAPSPPAPVAKGESVAPSAELGRKDRETKANEQVAKGGESPHKKLGDFGRQERSGERQNDEVPQSAVAGLARKGSGSAAGTSINAGSVALGANTTQPTAGRNNAQPATVVSLECSATAAQKKTFESLLTRLGIVDLQNAPAIRRGRVSGYAQQNFNADNNGNLNYNGFTTNNNGGMAKSGTGALALNNGSQQYFNQGQNSGAPSILQHGTVNPDAYNQRNGGAIGGNGNALNLQTQDTLNQAAQSGGLPTGGPSPGVAQPAIPSVVQLDAMQRSQLSGGSVNAQSATVVDPQATAAKVANNSVDVTPAPLLNGPANNFQGGNNSLSVAQATGQIVYDVDATGAQVFEILQQIAQKPEAFSSPVIQSAAALSNFRSANSVSVESNSQTSQYGVGDSQKPASGQAKAGTNPSVENETATESQAKLNIQQHPADAAAGDSKSGIAMPTQRVRFILQVVDRVNADRMPAASRNAASVEVMERAKAAAAPQQQAPAAAGPAPSPPANK